MKDKKIHIVSFDVPFPPDYGGVIDVYYRAKALKENGIYVILHCFEYGRGTNHDFSDIANEIYYYPRKKSFLSFLTLTPFIIKTRVNQLLIERLLKDNDPILLEGTHCTSIILDKRLRNRSVFVRVHNVENQYYRQLSKFQKFGFKKLYFYLESFKLKLFEKNLGKAKALFCITDSDLSYYQKINKNGKIWELGVNLLKPEPSEKVLEQALFHGNLSVPENEFAFLKLIDFWQVQKIDKPLIIAGKDPNPRLKEIINCAINVSLIENPSEIELNDLLRCSKYSLLISFQKSGMKIKLINSLLKGNICIATEEMLYSTGLDDFTIKIKSLDDLLEIFAEEYSPIQSEIQKRQTYILNKFDINENARRIIKEIFEC
jgi:hypothetical protein